MEREREIRAFVPEAFWVITAILDYKKHPLTFTCSDEPRDLREAERIVQEAQHPDWKIVSVKETDQRRSPYPPFTTSTLQQAASTRLGFAPSRTMAIAQKLYESGHITYMRTDSPSLSQAALAALAATVTKVFGKEHLEVKNFKTKSKTAQEAHEAIRPTHPEKRSAGTTPEQKKLYELIWTRAVSSQMMPARIMKTRIAANIEGSPIPDFILNGSRVMYDGWLLADPRARGDDVEVPHLNDGDALQLISVSSEEKSTTPPNRYSEAGLVKELEKRGIGRPSTYASIMKNLVDREYVEKQGKTLIPTATGDVVSTFLEDNFGKYISDSFTSEMEDELDDIATGEREYKKTLHDFYGGFRKDLEAKENVEKLTNLGPAPAEFVCPLCGSSMAYKLGRGGKFMSCTRYPECEGARTETGGVVEPDTPIGTYPETGQPIFVLNGKFGPYVQVGDPKVAKEKGKKKTKPKRASLPKGKDPETVTLEEALVYLSLPRVLGNHPDTNEPITASVGRFGPYIVHQTDFRSLKTDDVYTIELDRALEIFKEPKKLGRGRFAKKKK